MDEPISRTQANVLKIDEFLMNLHYPIDKGELIDAAIEAGLDTYTMEKLEQIPEDSYEDETEISDALGDADMS